MSSTSPFRTSEDLITEVLANLGVLASGQPTDPEDFNYIQEKLDSILRELAALEIAYVPDSDNIPGEYFSAIADIVAGECATKFGAINAGELIDKGIGGAQRPVGAGAAAMKLKIMTRGKPTYETLRTESF